MKQRQGPVMRVAAPVKGVIQRFAYAGLVVAAFGVMMLGKADNVLVETVRANVTDAVAPILDVLSRPAATLTEATDAVREMATLREENQRLREENRRLLEWQLVARKLDAENAQLKELSKAVPEAATSFITARVIGDAGGPFAHSLLLAAGTENGMRKGQAVISGQGLVGRVQSVGRWSSWVLLITDLNSHIPVTVEATRVRGIMAGANTTRPRLIHLPQGASVNPGDRIVTSGHGDAFPPGLPVGVVAAVSDDMIEIQPFVDRDRLEYVRAVDFGLKGILSEQQAVPLRAARAGR